MANARNPIFRWRGGAPTERDRDLEDYISGGLRRVYSTGSVLGDGSNHSGAWAVVAPAVTLTYPKMLQRSKIVVHGAAHGEADGVGWAQFGVRATLADGTVLSTVRFARVATVAGPCSAAGSAHVAVGEVGGETVLDLMVQTSGITWTSLSTADLNFSAVESL